MSEKRKEKQTYNLKCFRNPYHLFTNNEDVYRDIDGYPVCKDCLMDDLFEEWEYEAIDNIILDLDNKFDKNYKKFMRWYEENYVKCASNKHFSQYSQDFWAHKDRMNKLNGKYYCENCFESLVQNPTKESEK